MASTVKYHVTPVGELWKVGIEGDSQADSLHASKREALLRAEQLALHERGSVVVHRPDGSIEADVTPGGGGGGSIPGRRTG